MYGVVDIEYIRKKHLVEGWSIRRIAGELHVCRQTVRRALDDPGPWSYSLKADKPCPVMDPYRDVITQWLKDDEKAPKTQRHTAARIYRRLCDEHGFQGAESTVRRYVRRLREKLRPKHVDPFLVLEADPGEMAQVDWATAIVYLGGTRTTVHLFCMRMKYSKVPFVWAATNELEIFLEGHVRAFNWLGGVPQRIVYDNVTTAIKKILSGHDRELNERFVVLRSHYLFDSVFCNVAAAWEKGAVENLVGYVRQNCLTPVPSVNSIEELNSLLLEWCEKERQKHNDQWNLELQGLRELPKEVFRACVSTHTVVSNKLSLVIYERNRYSVPCEFMGQVVRIDAFTDRIEIYSRDKLIACHNRDYGRNHTSLQLDHYLSALERKPYAVMNASVVRRLPEPFDQAWEILCRRSPERYKEMVSILLLHREFSREQIAEAVRKCLQAGFLGFREVKQFLLNEQDCRSSVSSTELPASVVNVVVPVTDPSSYDVLMGGERMDSGLLALEGLIDLHCKTLKLPGIRKVYRELAREALDNGVSPTQFLLSCLEHEAKSRRENKLKANLRAAKFPEPKTLDQFNFAEIPSLPKAKVLSLFDCQFIRQKENVICVGRQGTGKTHISIALGMAAIEAGFRVKFIKAVTLAQELMAAQQDVRLNKYLKSWKKVDLVILDELGYLQLGPGAAPMFQFIAERYETGSMLVTSNLEFSRWGEVFSDPVMTSALLDRLTHRCHILVFDGESYRLKESRRRHESIDTAQDDTAQEHTEDAND